MDGEGTAPRPGTIAVVGDVHGHLQLALCVLARWQHVLGAKFEAVLLCGDVGTFTEYAQLDSATLSHARRNPHELEFLEQWAPDPPAPWLARIFDPPDVGLGLTCPVVMVHGNHEGFEHLERLAPRRRPLDVFPIDELPVVDAGGFIRFLPSGSRTVTASGVTVAGVGGIEPGQRRARYHRMAYIDDDAVTAVADAGPVDVLITHQGPAAVQGEHGSPTLDFLVEAEVARVWCHGHATPNPVPVRVGQREQCLVVPLGDVAFAGRGASADAPGLDGWAYLGFHSDEPDIAKAVPPFWREYRRHHWGTSPDGRLVSPDLLRYIPR